MRKLPESPNSSSQRQALIPPKTDTSGSGRSSPQQSPRKDMFGRSSASDPFRDQVLIGVCIAALTFATASACLVLLLSFLGRVPLLEPDVRLLNWDKVWKAEVGGMYTDSISGWEEFRKSGTLDLDKLGSEEYSGPPKIAFMFLVRGPMPLIPLWEKFLQGRMEQVSIYIHASTEGYNVTQHLNSSSIFHGKQVPGVRVKWGGLGMIRAEKALIAEALQDPANQRFVLLSESCIPVRSFDYVREYLFSTNKSFITSHQTDWRYPNLRKMQSIPRSKFRKGSQWVALTRKHAALVNLDHKYFSSFAETAAYIPDESYIQTLVPLVDPGSVEPRTVSFVHWPSIFAAHPTTFSPEDITTELIKEIQTEVHPPEETVDSWWSMSVSPPCQLNGKEAPCFLFARKFKEDSVPKLLNVTRHFGY